MPNKKQIIGNLRRLRQEIEKNRLMSFEAACMMFDCCLEIGLEEGEIWSILGSVYNVIEEELEKA